MEDRDVEGFIENYRSQRISMQFEHSIVSCQY